MPYIPRRQRTEGNWPKPEIPEGANIALLDWQKADRNDFYHHYLNYTKSERTNEEDNLNEDFQFAAQEDIETPPPKYIEHSGGQSFYSRTQTPAPYKTHKRTS